MNILFLHNSVFRKSLLIALILGFLVFGLLMAKGNNLGSPGNFPPAKGAAMPIISSVEVAEITNSTAVIRWETNKAVDRQVDYGTSEIYEFTSELETRPDTKHEVFLVDLEPGLTYHFQVRSRDLVGNLVFSENATFMTLTAQRGQASICGWDGDSVERVDTFCVTQDGWAKGESWTEFCTVVWTQTTSLLAEECIYQFSSVKSHSSIAVDESWQVTLEPNYTGWVDVLIVESPFETDNFLPAAYYAEKGEVTMGAVSSPGKYSFRFRPADDSAAWSDLLTITVRKSK